jgi:hypothetical protein
MSKYYIRYEKVGGNHCYMIYRQFLFFHFFYERWNSIDTAVLRLNELKG